MTAPGGAQTPGGIHLRAEATEVGIDSRRGLVRIAPSVLAALGARPYSVVRLTGAKSTGALVAQTGDDQDPGVIRVDDLILSNLGVAPGTPVTVEVVPSLAADRIVLTGPEQVTSVLPPQTARLALLGKVVCQGDSVSLLQQDLALPEGASVELMSQGRLQLQQLFGAAWQGMVLTAVEAPSVPTVVTMSTDVQWVGTAAGSALPGPAPAGAAPAGAMPAGAASATGGIGTPVATVIPPAAAAPALTSAEAKQLRELLDVGLNNPSLLTKLGTAPSLGVLVTGPAGCGKKTMVGQVGSALGLTVRSVWCPQLASLTPDQAASQLAALKAELLGASGARELLVLDEIEALAPAEGDAPLAAVLVSAVRELVAAGRAVIGLTATPDTLDRDLVEPAMLSNRIVIPLPDQPARRALLGVLTQPVALSADVSLDDLAAKTPGFVVADLVALVTAAGRQAALREQAAPSPTPCVCAADFAAALATVHPSSMDGQLLDPGDVGMADIGGLDEVKQVLTEAVLWPIAYPDTFARLGVAPTRGVLLYGPPGCGKTYLIKALAHDGHANVLSVKGAELMSKWVGESEAGVRQLFARARGAAPSLVFLDEVDALAPPRGAGAADDGVGDRVVAALLTELDGIDQLRGVVVVAATNRPDMIDPALLRPGRLERLLFVPPPDQAARAAILKAAAAHTPLDPSVDLTALAARTDGFSGADCAALIRQAALAAMRRSMQAPSVTAADIESALAVVHPSLDPAQLEKLQEFAAERGK
ncbi:MAG TPA: AAA family ATPase [Mycobacteriales bacterium]|nr:AAA family ATPase [Mycobacteriales bacterium]